jgi:hypothetical protein
MEFMAQRWGARRKTRVPARGAACEEESFSGGLGNNISPQILPELVCNYFIYK